METKNISLELYEESLVESNYTKYYNNNSKRIHKAFKEREWKNITSMKRLRLIAFNKALNYAVLHNNIKEVSYLLEVDDDKSEEYIEDKHNEVVREATIFEFAYPEELRELQVFLSMHYKKVESRGNTFYNISSMPTVDEVATELGGWIPDIKKEHLMYTGGFLRFINRDYSRMGKSSLHSYMSVVRGYNKYKRLVAAAYLQYIIGKKRALTACGLDKNTRLGLKSLISSIYKRNQAHSMEYAVALKDMYSKKALNYIDKYNSRISGGFQDEIRKYFYTVGLRYFSMYYRDKEMESEIIDSIKNINYNKSIKVVNRIKDIKNVLVNDIESSVKII